MSKILLTDDDYLAIASSTPMKIFGRSMDLTDMTRDLKMLLQRHHHESATETTIDFYHILRRKTQTLCKRFLRISDSPREQKDRVAIVLKHIHEEYPYLFGTDKNACEERLFLVRSQILILQGGMRRNGGKNESAKNWDVKEYSLHKGKIGSSASSVQKMPVATIVSEPRTFLRRPQIYSPPRVEDTGSANSLPTLPVAPTVQKSNVVPPTPPIHVLSTRPSSQTATQSQNTILPPSSKSSRPMTSLTTESSIITEHNDRGTQTDSGTTINSVHTFLSVCRPSLLHLSEYFYKYGCTTDEHLLQLATWEKNKRYWMLKDMLQGVAKMEILLVEKHLDESFGVPTFNA